ncbi:MAG TPA: DUF349 domain-containing protein [Rhodocyclaceae bacterium]
MTWIKNILSKDSETPETAKPASKAKAAAPVREPQPEDPPAERLAAILRCRDREQALAWSLELAGDPWLGQLAIRGRFAEVRLAAVRRIVDHAVLAEVAEACRNKDKGVYRHCHDQLRQQQTADDTARRAGTLADELRALLATAPLALSRLLDLEHALLALPGADEDPTVAECRPLLAEAHARLQHEALLRRDLTQCEEQAATLQAAVFAARSEWPEATTLASWEAEHARLQAACAEAPDWLAALPSTHKLAETLAVLRAALDTIAEDQRRLATALAFLDSLPTDTPLDASHRDAWAALEKPANAQAAAIAESRWQTLQPAPKAPAAKTDNTEKPRGDKAAKPDLGAQRKLVEAFETALAQGHLAEAATIDKTLADTVPPGALEQRLQRARSQLGQLNGWARWGTDQARDHLVTAAEQLLAAGLPVEELTKQVPALRESWKQLNGQGHPRKGQWEQFDAALTAAFAPVLAKRAEDAEKHKAAKAAKRELLDVHEAFVASPAWTDIGFDQRDQWRRELLDSWRAAGHASFRDERALRKRLDALFAQVDQQAETAREAERARRGEIIAAAEALAEAPDLSRAINDAKGLQRRWTPAAGAIRLARKEEQKLWKAFRAACDRVFARRDGERAAQAAEREEQAKATQAHRDAFAATLDAAEAGGSDLRTLREALQAFRNSPSGHDNAARTLEQRAQTLIERLTLDRHRARFELMKQKALLAESIEAVAGSGDTAAGSAARAEWEALTRLPTSLEAPLARRFEAATTATIASLEAGSATRAAQLLDLEIALDLPSPPALADTRRMRQLERLKQHFGAASAPSADSAELLAQCLGIAASPDADAAARIDAVIGRLVQQAIDAERETRRESRPSPRHKDPTRAGRRDGRRDSGDGRGRRDRRPQPSR